MIHVTTTYAQLHMHTHVPMHTLKAQKYKHRHTNI